MLNPAVYLTEYFVRIMADDSVVDSLAGNMTGITPPAAANRTPQSIALARFILFLHFRISSLRTFLTSIFTSFSSAL